MRSAGYTNPLIYEKEWFSNKQIFIKPVQTGFDGPDDLLLE